MIPAKPFLEEYGNFGVKPAQLLGVYPSPAINGIFANRTSVPVNPESLIQGSVLNELTFAGSNLIASHFVIAYKIGSLTIYKSDGTDPNLVLTGVVGDLCFGANSGKSYYCSTAPTTWTAM